MAMKLILGGTIAAGLAAGFAWPTGPAPSAPTGHEEVVLARSADRHFYADASVDGRPVRFLVDTGSSAIALTQEDARRLGIAFDPARFELIGEGASGLVRGQYVEVASVAVGAIEKRNVRVAIVEGAAISLLGQPFLGELDEIVIRKEEMRLRTQG